MELHPSLLIIFPSSHFSVETHIPSPHFDVQVDALPGKFVQIHPLIDDLQSDEQPIPSFDPSSHVSSSVIIPSPQLYTQ